MKWPSMAIALLISLHSAHAQDRVDPATGRGYLAICSREEEDWRTACNFYAAGMNNMLIAIDMIAGGHKVECTPGDTTLADKQRIFLAFLRANPDLQDGGSPALYMQALSDAFPCPPK
jgi:Rap1a immunity proteins